MEKYGKWLAFDRLGEGGQGTVYLAHDTSKVNVRAAVGAIRAAIGQIAGPVSEGAKIDNAKNMAERIAEYVKSLDTANYGALKLLHPSKDDAEFVRQLGRMRDEIAALRGLSHPNVVKILDEKLEDRWFVTEHFPQGALPADLGRHRGDFSGALLAFRPLVEAVASLHDKRLVHRDIKPENIFLSSRGLVLADFGLVHFADDQRTRLSGTLENVGSRDWMPGWAMGMKLEDVRPSFDVFSLGKVLWSMVSGQPKLQLWYHHKNQFELEKMFPNNPDVLWARMILDRCVVEDEDECLPDARELLEEVDKVLSAVGRNAQVISNNVVRVCRVCGLGQYAKVADNNLSAVRNFGVNPTGSSNFKIFSCKHCGHTELFYLTHGRLPPAWK